MSYGQLFCQYKHTKYVQHIYISATGRLSTAKGMRLTVYINYAVSAPTAVSCGHARITARYPTVLLVGMTSCFTHSPRPSAVRGAAVMEPGREASRAAVIARENTLRRTLTEAILSRECNYAAFGARCLQCGVTGRRGGCRAVGPPSSPPPPPTQLLF